MDEWFEFLVLPCLDGLFDEMPMPLMETCQSQIASCSNNRADCLNERDTSAHHHLKETVSQHPLSDAIVELLGATCTDQPPQLPPPPPCSSLSLVSIHSTANHFSVSSSLVDIYCLVSNCKLHISKIHLDFYKSTLNLTPTRTRTKQGIARVLLNNGGATQRRKHMKHPSESTLLLDQWFRSHISCPYPSEQEKEWLAKLTGLTGLQVNYWFINARKRRLRPKQQTPPTHHQQKVERQEGLLHRVLATDRKQLRVWACCCCCCCC